MSKHEKALRELFRVVKTDIPCRPEYRRKLWADAEAAADHIKRLEAQLRIATRAIESDVQEWDRLLVNVRDGTDSDTSPKELTDMATLNIKGNRDALVAMRKAARRKTNG